MDERKFFRKIFHRHTFIYESFQNKFITSMFLKLKVSAIIFIALVNEYYKKNYTNKILFYFNACSCRNRGYLGRYRDK